VDAVLVVDDGSTDRSAEPLTDGPSGVAVVRALDAIARSVRNAGREEEV
jgi:hypothetical protein